MVKFPAIELVVFVGWLKGAVPIEVTLGVIVGKPEVMLGVNVGKPEMEELL